MDGSIAYEGWEDIFCLIEMDNITHSKTVRLIFEILENTLRKAIATVILNPFPFDLQLHRKNSFLS